MRRAPRLPGTRAFVSTGELEGLAEENHALAISCAKAASMFCSRAPGTGTIGTIGATSFATG